MTIGQWALGLAVAVWVGGYGVSTTAAEAQSATAPAPDSNQKSAVITYVPPKAGAPRGRVGGGARGAEGDMRRLTVLAPDHPGRTVETQPVLYWYASEATSDPVEFTLMNDEQIYPVVERKVADSVQPGVHKISLADLGIKLSPSMTYRWYVSLVQDPARRSRDIIAGGVIEHADPPDSLAEKLSKATAEDKTKLFAEAGMWYDAIAMLSSLIEMSPGNLSLREQRAALLEQVGLLDVARYDRKDGSLSSN